MKTDNLKEIINHAINDRYLIFMRFRPLFSVLTATSVLALGACQLIYGPSPMPKGYTHLQGKYKTPQNERPFFIGPEYSEEEVLKSEILWTDAANDLLNKLQSEIMMNDMVVSLQPAAPGNSFEVMMDYYLREVLRDRGYMIITEPSPDVPVIEYSGAYINDGTTFVLTGDNEMPDPDGIPAQIFEDEKTTTIYLSLSIIDTQAEKETDRKLLTVKKPYPILNKDLREIALDIYGFPAIVGGKYPPEERIKWNDQGRPYFVAD